MATLAHDFVNGFCTVCQESEMYALMLEDEADFDHDSIDWEAELTL